MFLINVTKWSVFCQGWSAQSAGVDGVRDGSKLAYRQPWRQQRHRAKPGTIRFFIFSVLTLRSKGVRENPFNPFNPLIQRKARCY